MLLLFTVEILHDGVLYYPPHKLSILISNTCSEKIYIVLKTATSSAVVLPQVRTLLDHDSQVSE
jgi:hypothetical protein